MKSYAIPVTAINKFSDKDFSLYSFSARDYRKLLLENKNTVKLKDLLERKEKVGKEIGSEAYMDKSKYRFLKTVNISSNFLLEESSIEYCKPENKVFPKKNEILIAKDGGGNGLGEITLYTHENKENTDSLSAGIIAIKIQEEKRNYVLGFLKSQHFKDFVDLNTAQGSTIRHSKLIALDYEIPFPTTANHPNPEKVENLVSLIVQNIIDKEEQIKIKNKQIDELIEKELKENQKAGSFSYKYPKISEIREETRFDTGLYEREFKEEEYLIENYHNGFGGIFDLEYEISRGQNLQVSNIGLSFYSDQPKKNFYKLILSKYFTGRTFEKVSYLGNAKKLKTIKKGDIVFSCRGEMGRCVIFPETTSNTITNIDNVHISSESRTITEKLFLFCFLGYLKQKDILDSIACTGSGAPSFTQYQFSKLKIPNFPESKQQEIAKLYYNPLEKNTALDLENYFEREQARNREVGIFQFNMEIFTLREQLEDLVHKILMEEKIELRFEY